jgi:SM-20-related protein
VHSQPTTTPKFDLHIVKDFFDANTCREVVNDMRDSPAAASLTYGKGEAAVDERVRRASRVSPSAKTVAYVTRRLEEYRRDLERHFGVELSGCEPPQFLCYRIGDFFVAHQDGNTGLINLDSDRTRRISITLFLNNQSAEQQSDTYNGGSLVFSDWRTGSRHEVSGEAGTLVAFRSETTHEVTPVTHGERYAIVTWYGQYGPPDESEADRK